MIAWEWQITRAYHPAKACEKCGAPTALKNVRFREYFDPTTGERRASGTATLRCVESSWWRCLLSGHYDYNLWCHAEDVAYPLEVEGTKTQAAEVI